MANYSDHSRFFYSNYKEIQDNINNGKINQWDIVICSDTQEQILITDNFDQVVIKSRVYRFLDIESAETFLNNSPDTYSGQIVSILSSKGNYAAYIVNTNSIGKFTVQAISVYEAGDLNYSDLGQRPIDNLESDIENPAILSEQETGIYKIDGAYKLSPTYSTIFQSSNSNLYLVSYDSNDNALIKIITTENITDYVVADNGEILSKSDIATTEFLEQQNYITEAYLDSRLASLDMMTRNDAQIYIKQLLDEYLSDAIDKQLDTKLNEKLIPESEQDIRTMISKIL